MAATRLRDFAFFAPRLRGFGGCTVAPPRLEGIPSFAAISTFLGVLIHRALRVLSLGRRIHVIRRQRGLGHPSRGTVFPRHANAITCFGLIALTSLGGGGALSDRFTVAVPVGAGKMVCDRWGGEGDIGFATIGPAAPG